MALKTCRECQTLVSTDAQSCLQCGSKYLRGPGRAAKLLGGILFLGVGAYGIISLTQGILPRTVAASETVKSDPDVMEGHVLPFSIIRGDSKFLL